MGAVVLPGPLRQLTGAPGTLRIDGATAGDVLRELERRYPGVAGWVLDESGRLREHIRLFVGEREATLETPLTASCELHIVRAISGGCSTAIQAPNDRSGGIEAKGEAHDDRSPRRNAQGPVRAARPA